MAHRSERVKTRTRTSIRNQNQDQYLKPEPAPAPGGDCAPTRHKVPSFVMKLRHIQQVSRPGCTAAAAPLLLLRRRSTRSVKDSCGCSIRLLVHSSTAVAEGSRLCRRSCDDRATGSERAGLPRACGLRLCGSIRHSWKSQSERCRPESSLM